MSGYKYEVHMHTWQGSACGKTRGEDYVQAFKDAGYDGIIITDHFFRGNTRPDRKVAWEDYIDEYCKGYEAAKEAGDKIGLKVFFGWEECFGPDEGLVYGLDKAWLKAHPEMLEWDHKTYREKINEAGGAIVEAHPFRERGYINCVNLHPFQFDAWEVSNFGNQPYQDVLAYNYAKKHGITMTSGSDIHDVAVVETTPCGMVFDEPLNSSKDYADRIKSGKGFKALIPEDRQILIPEMRNTLPMRLFDENNVPKDVTFEDLF